MPVAASVAVRVTVAEVSYPKRCWSGLIGQIEWVIEFSGTDRVGRSQPSMPVTSSEAPARPWS